MRNADVVVAGAGPAGCAAAVTIARAGRRVLLLDRARFPRDKCCGDGLTAGALRRLRRLGLDPSSVASWTEIAEVMVRSPSGRVCRFPFPPGPSPSAAAARRFDLDFALVERARAEGVTVLEGHRVTGADCDGEGVTLQVAGEDPVRAPYAIGADGMWSPLRKAAGLVGQTGYLGEWHAFRQYWRGTSQSARQMWVWFEPELLPGYAWSFPVGDGVANVGFGVLRRGSRRRGLGGVGRVWRSDRSPAEPSEAGQVAGRPDRSGAKPSEAGDRDGHWPTGRHLAQLQELVLGRAHVRQVLGTGAEPESPLRTWPIPARLARSDLAGGGGRILFVGDAARAPDPMTGEGIAQALETGELAARAVLAAGPADPGSAAAIYRRSVRAGLALDDQLARLLAVALRSPVSARGAIRAAAATPWVSRQFARWLFEDYPRAYLATPWRWRKGTLTKSGSYR
jgi:flavin-dependent dehydrogenase